MRRFVLLLAASAAACSVGRGSIQVQQGAPSFRAKTLAIAAARGAKARGPELTAELARRLEEGGIHAASLENSDSVLAGSSVGMDIASDPRVLSEVRRATGAEAVVFLTLDPGWRLLDIAVLDIETGDPVLRATARPRGAFFETPEEAAAAAADALSALAPSRRRAAAAARDSRDGDEIPVP